MALEQPDALDAGALAIMAGVKTQVDAQRVEVVAKQAVSTADTLEITDVIPVVVVAIRLDILKIKKRAHLTHRATLAVWLSLLSLLHRYCVVLMQSKS